MKTLAEIRNLTEQAKKEKEEKKLIAKKKAIEKAKKDRQEMIQRAKDVSFFEEEIEEMAKEGKTSYSISIGQDDGSEYFKLHKKYIKKYLKDFNPTFTEEQHEGCEYNYEGGPIDGSEYTYTAIHVHFNW